MTYGLTPEGFIAKTPADIFEEIASDQTRDIGPLWNARGLGLPGVVNSIVATQLGAAWSAIAQVASQFDRANAEGAALESIGDITGTRRLPKRRTVVQATCVMEPGTSVDVGQMLAHIAGHPEYRYRNSFAFIVPSTGLAGITVQFESEEFGPIPAPATFLSFRIAPVMPEWFSVVNPTDGVPGSLAESDADFKLRQELELANAGSATNPAMFAALSNVANVVSVAVIGNDTDAAVDTVPPHSMECVVEGGDSNDIATAIFNTKAAGDGTSGTTNVVVNAPDGLQYVVHFTRPTGLPIYLNLTVQVTSEFPGVAALKSAIAEWANRIHSAGFHVVPSRIGAKAFETPGVWNVTNATAGLSGLSTSTAVIPVGVRQRATFDPTRIAVTVVA